MAEIMDDENLMNRIRKLEKQMDRVIRAAWNGHTDLEEVLKLGDEQERLNKPKPKGRRIELE